MAKFLRHLLQTKKYTKGAGPRFKVVFIRHGESEWNQKNLFCGWFDAKLSNTGRSEAKEAGYCLKKLKLKFHHGFTSRLIRSMETLDIILCEINQADLPIDRHWRLNERHYGNLTGMNKAEAMELFGKEKVHIWRRSYDTKPPKMLDVNPHFAAVMDGSKYNLKPDEVPLCESLKDTVARVLPFWEKNITKEIVKGKNVIVAAHGNSLRGIVKHIEGISDYGIQFLNLPTGVPFVYTLDECLKPVKGEAVEFLGDAKKAEAAIADLHKAKTAVEKKEDKKNGDC